MLTFCAHVLVSASHWLDGHCFHSGSNTFTKPLDISRDRATPCTMPLLSARRSSTSPRAQYTIPIRSLEPYPSPPRSQLRTARANAIHITTSLLAIDFLLDSRFKAHGSASTALVAIRRIIRSEHGGVFPDVLLDEWLRKGRPYAAGTRSKFAKDPVTGRGLSFWELGRCVDAWAEWGRVRGAFRFLFDEEDEEGEEGKEVKDGEGLSVSFKRVGEMTEAEFKELERRMWAWIKEKERAREQRAADAPVSIPDVDAHCPTVAGLFASRDTNNPRGTSAAQQSQLPAPPQRPFRGNWIQVVLNQDQDQEWESADDVESNGHGNSSVESVDGEDKEQLWMQYHSLSS